MPPAPDESTGPSEAAPAASDAGRAPLRFLRKFVRALADDETYDVRRNPSLWVGFLMALPIPFLVWAANPPGWLLAVSLPAPVFWAVVLGAAGRVGTLAVLRAQRLEVAIEETQDALDEEVSKREDLEAREKRVESEMKLAEAVHRTLVPSNIQRPDVEVAVRQIPSQFVGGDYLYASIAGNRYLYLCVGDVSGHGVSAALVVARLHGLIRRLTFAKRSRPVTLLERLNRAALQIFQHTYFFMTFAVFRLDLESGKLRYATAGHPPQVLLRKDGRIELLRTPNRLLGMDDAIFDPHHPSDRVTMEPGDSLVLFTDGLFEILSDKDGQILDEPGLHERIASLKGLGPQLMAGEILQELADFQGSSTFEDDVSLMVMTYRGRSGESEDLDLGIATSADLPDAPEA